MRCAAPRRATTWPRPRAGTAYPRPPRITNPFYTAGWVRSCLQDESGRTNRACDWPARTCNASGSRADCAVSRRLPGQSRASLPAREAAPNATDAFFGYAIALPLACLPPFRSCPAGFPNSLLSSCSMRLRLSRPAALGEPVLLNFAANSLPTLFFPRIPELSMAFFHFLIGPSRRSFRTLPSFHHVRYRSHPMMIGLVDLTHTLPPFSLKDGTL